MGYPRNEIGKKCVKGIHDIRSEADLLIMKKPRNMSGDKSRACRQCKSDYMKEWRASRSKIPKEKLHKNSLLERGECERGHTIRSRNDLVVKKTELGQRYNKCKICDQSRPREQRRFIIFDCSHQITFSPPLPWVGETVFCMRCRDYRIVATYGEVNIEAQEGKAPPTKVDWDLAQQIRELSAEGVSYAVIGKRFDLASPAISNIVNFKTWKVDPNAKRQDSR